MGLYRLIERYRVFLFCVSNMAITRVGNVLPSTCSHSASSERRLSMTSYRISRSCFAGLFCIDKQERATMLEVNFDRKNRIASVENLFYYTYIIKQFE